MIMFLLMVLLFLSALFLIVLVLVQRGKGGGLAGAFGGMGGQSAFGTKAGDLFTRVTIVVATVWIVLCIASVAYFGQMGNLVAPDLGGGAPLASDAVSASPETDQPTDEKASDTAPQEKAAPADSGSSSKSAN